MIFHVQKYNKLDTYYPLDIQTPPEKVFGHQKDTYNTKPQEVWLDV